MVESKCYGPKLQKIRGAIYLYVEAPDRGGFWARITGTSILACIAVSIACLMLETVPQLRGPEFYDFFWTVELVSTVIFTLEYLLRLWVCDVYGTQTIRSFVRAPTNVLDLLAILPFYIDSLLDGINFKRLRGLLFQWGAGTSNLTYTPLIPLVVDPRRGPRH